MDVDNPDEANPDEANPDEANPDEANPDEANPGEANPGEANPDEENPDEANPVAMLIKDLNNDCLKEIFEWLSLDDIIQIGQTCKRIKQASGEYIPKYCGIPLIVRRTGIIYRHRSFNIFNNYIRKVFIPENFIEISNPIEPYRYVGVNCPSLKEIRLKGYIPKMGINFIKSLLNRIKVVDLSECSIRKEFYTSFLIHCLELESLSVTKSNNFSETSAIIGTGNDWMKRTYPTLKHFELRNINILKENELHTFFYMNPNVRSFSIDSQSLVINKNIFLTIDAKLDKLAIEFDAKSNLQIIQNLLDEMYVRGFFKKLHFYCHARNGPVAVNSIFTPRVMESLEMLHGPFISINIIPENYHLLKNVTTLVLHVLRPNHDLTQLTVQLPNLERVSIRAATTDQFSPFIYKSPKLRALTVHSVSNCMFLTNYQGGIRLSVLNERRSWLKEACKVVLYLDETFALWYKRRYRIKYPFIEMSRYDWFNWKDLNAEFKHHRLNS